MEMIPVRIFFEKAGRAKYISHLDTMRTMTRAFRRSGLPFWYTQGFNPHLYMTFALPISLGYESLCESADLRFTQPVDHALALKALQDSLPDGFAVYRVAAPVTDPTEIAWADYDIVLSYRQEDTAGLAAQLRAFLEQPSIPVAKRTKKGEKELDIRPLTELLEAVEESGALRLRLRLAAGVSLNVNPTLPLGAFYRWCGREPNSVRVVRTRIYDKERKDFV